jgi:ATP-dependent DNA helicase RecG
MLNSIDWLPLVEAALANKSETNEIDFKKSVSEEKNERLKEHINAFGNHPTGGLFVFGICRDFTFSTSPIDQEAAIQKITSLANDSQMPPLRAVVHHLTIKGHNVLGVEICPGSKCPVFIKGRDPWSGAFKRSGSSTIAMGEQEIRDLLAQAQKYNFDEETITGTSVNELSFSTIEEHIENFRADQGLSKSNVEILLDNRIVKLASGQPVPTLAGWMVFAKNPQSIRSMKNASIEFQQFRGKNRDEPIRKLEINGTLIEQVQNTIAVLQQNMWRVPKLQGIKREDVPSYDEVTLREVVTNSVVHRDYQQLHQPVKVAMFSDRVEVENPGGLLPGLTPLNLIHKRAWRNESIANLMSKIGLGEMDGQGIDRIFTAIHRLKVPAPQISDDKRSFKIVLSAPKAYEEYSPQERRLTLLVLLILEQETDNERVRNAFGINATKASTLLKQMVEEGILRRTTKSMKYAKYRLDETYLTKVNS